MNYFLCILLCICFCTLPAAGQARLTVVGQESVYSQDTPKENDLKVGLVLSGGGAKGFAHIGALKVIEETGVRIDYIAGTSIGAIVGGLYASGYSAKELDSIFKSVEFNALVQDKVPRSQKTFYEKEADERYAVTLPFDRFKLSVPSAISKGQNSYNLLVRLLDDIKVSRFDELPIPFFCIATDVETGEEIVLDKGYLPEALSASGSLPSLYRPVAFQGRLFTDGGVTNNYPIEALKAKGVDIIIGIDVQDQLRDRQKLKSAPEVLIQINNFRTIEAMKEKRKLTDIYIRPDIDNYTVVSFNEVSEIIEEGTRKALLQQDELKAIALKQKHPNTTLTKQRSKLKPGINDSINIDRVTVQGNTIYPDKYVLGKLKIKPPQAITYGKLEEGINNLAGSKNFGRIAYQIKKEASQNTLDVTLRESFNTQNIRLGLHYDDLYRSAALLNFSKKRLLFKDDMASFDFILGQNIRYQADYHIDKGFWNIGFRSALNVFEEGLSPSIVQRFAPLDFGNVNRVDIDYQDITNELYLRTLFIKTFSLEVGVQHKFLDVTTETFVNALNENEDLPLESSNLYGASGRLLFDSLDHRYFPTSGVYFDGHFDLFLFADDLNANFTEFSIANATLKYAKRLSSHFTLIGEGAGGFKIGGSTFNSLDFFLGGYGNSYVNTIIPFLGYDFLSLSGDGYVKAALHLDYAFYKKHHLTLTANYANIEDGLFSSGEWFSSPDFSGYAIGYGFDTFLGPLQAKYSISPELEQGEWFISLGFWF